MDTKNWQSLTTRLISFRDQRDWQQFHSLKQLIISLNLEAAELLELTQWQNDDAYEQSMQSDTAKSRLKEECADILAYLLLIAERADFDIVEATHDKIDKNAIKYPVKEAKGNSTKYNRR